MRIKTISGRKASFPAIWKTITEAQRKMIHDRLVTELSVTDITLYRWRKGLSTPRQAHYRNGAACIVSEVTGRAFTPEELFPDK